MSFSESKKQGVKSPSGNSGQSKSDQREGRPSTLTGFIYPLMSDLQRRHHYNGKFNNSGYKLQICQLFGIFGKTNLWQILK